jgi:tetratricopeptide (TPR) repeat protein
MDAFVSGACGRAVLMEGTDAFILDIAEPEAEVSTSATIAYGALAGADDVLELKSTTRQQVLQHLEKKWSCDRALRLILILLNEDEYVEVKEEAAPLVNELLCDQEVERFATARLYAHPLPASADIHTVREISPAETRLGKLTTALHESQTPISLYRNAWDSIPDDMFEDIDARHRFEAHLIESGLFRDMVKAYGDVPATSAVIYSCLTDLKDERNFRTIISQWTKDIPKSRPRRLWPTQESEEDFAWDASEDANATPAIGAYAEYQNVLRQQDAIIAQLRLSNVRLARRFTEELVRKQLSSSGGASYASKSLCKLAQEAKALGLSSLQLEWAKRAAALSPHDAWAQGQAADAYISLSRFDEALKYLDLTEQHGDRFFAANGRARILKAQTKLDEALNAFICIEKDFSQHSDVVFAWMGHAETLRDMWFFEDSLRVYQKTIELFPDSRPALCGRAAVLADMGRLTEALDGYQEAIRLFGSDLYALTGRAEIWKQMGRLEDALAAYDSIVVSHGQKSVPYCGRADVLKLLGELHRASDAYREAKDRFPYISVPYCGLAEVLREQGKYEEALEVYDDALRRFQLEPYVRNGRANILKLVGKLDEALAAYDENVRLFPYNLICVNGRADLLKELGDFKNAISIYETIMKKWPGFQSAKHALAAILVVLNRYEDAERLLPSGPPRTRDEWIGYHVRGMILLRTDRIEEAITHFTNGSVTIPYASERRYYENALVIARLRQREFELATKLVKHVSGSVGNILQLHAFGASGRAIQAKNAYARAQDYCPPRLVELRDELASRFRLISLAPKHDEGWLFEKECDAALLLAA